MRRIVTPEEQSIIEPLKASGVIKKIDPAHMTPGVFCMCGDCDRSRDNYDFYSEKLREAGLEPRLHLIALNGGPLNLSYPHYGESPATRIIHTWVFETQIRGSAALKDLKRIILVGHWPCGQCEKWNMGLDEALPMLARTTDATRRQLQEENVEVVARIHFDKGETMNTYHFSDWRWFEFHKEEAVDVGA